MEKEVVLYARTSTSDQNVGSQLLALEEYCQRMGYEIADRFIDSGYSGKNDQRPEFERLLSNVRSGHVKCICVYKLDRIGRSLQHLLTLFDEFRNRNVQFVSITQNVNTRTPEGKMFFNMLLIFSEYERELIVARTRSGLDRARKEGKHCGRPKGSKDTVRRRRSGYVNRWLVARKKGK